MVDRTYTKIGGHGSKLGGGVEGFEVAVGQQEGAATRIAPYLPSFTSARGKARGGADEITLND